MIALGFFDGVHLGHGALLNHTTRLAMFYDAVPAVLTFDRDPGKGGGLLTSVSDRRSLIRRRYGIEEVLVLPFDETLRQTPWEVFLQGLVTQQEAVCFVCGWDYRFGHGGEGTPALLKEFCAGHSLGCAVVPQLKLDGKTVSSTLLRQLVADGDMEQAMRFYGHPHTLSGEVVHGCRLGRKLGAPTANIAYADGILLPRSGVYAVRAFAEDAAYAGVCNVGTRPTVGGSTVSVEVWLPGQSLDLYGKTLRLDFYKKLRDERKFSSVQELKCQITHDAAQAAAYFQTLDIR